MLRGLYTATSGMLVQEIRSELVSNNLANVETVGYHRQTAQIKAFPEMLLSRIHNQDKTKIGTLGTGAVVERSGSSFQQGRLHTTSNPLDVALMGAGFFVVAGPTGNRYTRDGGFTLSQAGWLVNQNGQRVLGESGPIFIGQGEVTIDSLGNVHVDGEFRDRLLIVEFPNRAGLIRQGSSQYEATPEAGAPFRYNTTVVQGALEYSNVNIINEMVNMITIQRSYEANQKVIQAYDETLGKAVNEIAG
ncbi:MAG: flagellar basal-body rod protein FlgF [Firmicutes bacterium]|nr:flagellar basal-body rod protein FlgF [Bacillota bacterium]